MELLNIDHDPLPYPADSLDFVLCEHTIEHLRNPKNLLTESYRVLRPGGMMWCATPNAVYLPKRLVFLRGKSPVCPIEDFYEQGLDFHGHIREYTSSDLVKVFRKAGFSRIDLKWYTGATGVWPLLGRLYCEFHQAVCMVAFK